MQQDRTIRRLALNHGRERQRLACNAERKMEQLFQMQKADTDLRPLQTSSDQSFH